MTDEAITPELLKQLPLEEIRKVAFFKRDEITSDLICCEVNVAGRPWLFHEELKGWTRLIEHLEQLPGFSRKWFANVAQPPFLASTFVAYRDDN